MKRKIHHMVDNVDDEDMLVEVSRILSGEPDILDEWTDEQIAGIQKGREEVKAGKGMSLAEHKQNLEQRLATRR